MRTARIGTRIDHPRLTGQGLTGQANFFITRLCSRSRDPLLSDLDNLMRRAIEHEIHIRNHPAVNSHSSLLNQPSRLAGRGGEVQVDEQSANPG